MLQDYQYCNRNDNNVTETNSAVTRSNFMPMYDWKCKKCNQVVTVMRSVVDIDVFPYEEEEILPCSEKDEENVDIPLLEKDIGDVRYDTHQKDIGDVRYRHKWERIMSQTSFQLLGSGWFNKGGY